MWQIQHDTLRTEEAFADSTLELLRDTSRNLMVAIAGLYLVWHFVATVTWPTTHVFNTWVLTCLMAGVTAASLALLGRSLVIAQLVWLAGLAAAISVAVQLYRQPEIGFLYALLPFMAAGILGWPMALTAEGAVLVLAQTFAPAYAVGIVLSGGVTGVVGWAYARSLLAVAHWSLAGFAEARRQTAEARRHRGELVRLNKELDQTLYLLERANAALDAAMHASTAAEQFKTEFVTNVSHELRTPLNLIVGFAEMMMTSPESYENQPLPRAYRSDLYSVYHSAQHLLELVDDVLDLARIEVGKIALAREKVDMAYLVRDAAAMVGDYVRTKGLTLHIGAIPDLPPLWLDRLRIRQVLLNLLVNAARFTEHGAIGIDVEQGDGAVVVRVWDSGRGIPEGDMARIFEEFRSTERPFSDWHSGTGLGLPISKKFVELHGGKMGVDSVPGQGASFWFTLPVAASGAAEKSFAGAIQARADLLAPKTTERIVVLVHRDRGIATLVKRYLDGVQVVHAHAVAEGVELAHELAAVALLVDEAEPEPLPPCACLVVRCPLPSAQLTANALGAEEMLVKPVSRQELLDAVDRLERPIRRVLIVDDDAEVTRLFRRMLGGRVAVRDCLEAFNGAEALARMREERPDLVLLDLVMPEVDGRSVLEQMRADPSLAGIPVLLISARGQDHLNLQLFGAVQVQREGGFELGEVVQMLAAMLNVLTPGWRPAPAAPSTALAGSPALADRPTPPTSAPVVVR